MLPLAALPPAALQMAAAMIRHFEGCRSLPYWDTYGRCWSIGYGFCTLADGNAVGAHTPALSSAECETLLEAKLRAEYMPAVLKQCVGVALSDGQLAALTSFAWNVGPGRIGQAGLPALIGAGHLAAAGAAMRQFDRAGGVVLAGLVARRAVEAAVLCGAGWPAAASHAASAPAAVESEADRLNDAELGRKMS